MYKNGYKAVFQVENIKLVGYSCDVVKYCIGCGHLEMDRAKYYHSTFYFWIQP